jgi:hypothetical protein
VVLGSCATAAAIAFYNVNHSPTYSQRQLLLQFLDVVLSVRSAPARGDHMIRTNLAVSRWISVRVFGVCVIR